MPLVYLGGQPPRDFVWWLASWIGVILSLKVCFGIWPQGLVFVNDLQDFTVGVSTKIVLLYRCQYLFCLMLSKRNNTIVVVFLS
jgi:hypothetical protein